MPDNISCVNSNDDYDSCKHILIICNDPLQTHNFNESVPNLDEQNCEFAMVTILTPKWLAYAHYQQKKRKKKRTHFSVYRAPLSLLSSSYSIKWTLKVKENGNSK